jgi:SAM-dependent methyltransferase
MRLGMIPEDDAEREALESGLVPVPFFETHMAFGLARAVMAATKLGVFESLTAGPATAAEIAARCRADPAATQKLLTALAGCGYLEAGDGLYALSPMARTWLVRESPRSLVHTLMFAYYEWDLMSHLEDYVCTGRPADVHEHMTGHQWELYQRSMRGLAAQSAHATAQAIPVPAGATTMIDIGGSHGYYSVALCRRHPGLRSVVLDLPEAISSAAPLLAAENMGDRVVHRQGDALTHDLGNQAYDVVLLSNLAHHFTAPQNKELFIRIARALRPNGVFAVLEPFRSDTAAGAGQLAALSELYFGLTSRSGTWTVHEIAQWQRDAGLRPATHPVALSSGDMGLQLAFKPPQESTVGGAGYKI